MIETQKFNTMLRNEEVRPEFTGLAHDHLMASGRIQSGRANNLHHHHYQQQQQQQHASQQAQPLGQSTQNVPPVAAAAAAATPFGCLNTIQDKTNIQKEEAEARLKQNDEISGASALSTIAILRRQTMFDSLVLVKKFRPCLNGYTLEFPTSNLDDQVVEQSGDNNNKSSRRSSENQVATSCARPDSDPNCGRTKLVSVYLDGDDPMSRMSNGFSGKSDDGDIVYVPVNGLLDRLDNYDRHGISIDSRVYAFAMGLKTAERFLTSSAEKEIQEAPPL